MPPFPGNVPLPPPDPAAMDRGRISWPSRKGARRARHDDCKLPGSEPGLPGRAPTIDRTSSLRHHFTVDVEEYFHASAMRPFHPPDGWDALPRRSPPVMHRLLDLLGEQGVRGTFFVLGWLAEREPDLVRRLAAEGHEIASHGWEHSRVTEQTPAEFRDGVRRSRALLQDLSGQPVLGYRAPSFSIVPGTEWALDVLLEEGYRYDSSLFPVRHPSYGYPCPRDPHWIQRAAGRILELPPCTLRRFGTTLPAAGGAYFRFLPSSLLHSALEHAESRGQPGTFYIHPWEFDPGFPCPSPSSFLTRIRMKGGTGRTWRRLVRLLDRFSFGPISDSLSRLAAPAAAAGGTGP